MSDSEDSDAQQYGAIVVVGGGCYGGYYVRQLHRAARAGAIAVREILVVDHDPECAVARELAANPEPGPATRVVVAEWRDYFDQYLAEAASRPAAFANDAIVPSPLMPHLMGEWLVERVRARWPGRDAVTQPFEHAPAAPWSRSGDDGVHYVSFATWMCPINCIEPRICPHTRDTRSWSLPTHLGEYARDETEAGRPAVMAVMHCRHRAYGVGMFDTQEVTAADEEIREAASARAVDVVIGTVSHCHGALTRLAIGAPLATQVDTPLATPRSQADSLVPTSARFLDMATTYQYDVVIVGAGPAGMCAGMYAGRSMLRTVVLERGFPGGELLNTELIEDYPGFETILGHELAQKFADHAAKFGAEFQNGVLVECVRKRDDGTFETRTESGDMYESKAVIVTAGGTPIKLGIPGEIEYAGKGVSYCAICDGAFFRGHTIAVVGGGDAATEEADFLTRYAEKVYLIHRRDELRSSKILQQRLFANPKIEMIWNSVVERVEADDHGLVRTLKLRDVITNEASDLAATALFVFVGFRPNTGIIDGHVEHDEMGYLRTDANMHTSIRGLFAAGDVRAQLTRQVTTAVGDATTAAIAVEKYLKALADGDATEPIVGAGGYAMKLDVRTVGPFQENSYLVVDESTGRAVLVDPGDEPERLIEMVTGSGATLDAIWLTHGHIDHIGGIAGVLRKWPVPVHMHKADESLYRRGASQAAAYGVPFEQPELPDRELVDGGTVSVGGLVFEVHHTPGHSPGHVILRHGDTILGGDLLFAGSIGRTDLPDSNPAHMEESLARICAFSDVTAVHPGHGPSTTVGRERTTNGFLTGAARIVKR